MVSEIKRIPLWKYLDPLLIYIHVHLYIVVQCGLSSICEDGTTITVIDSVKCSALVNKCVRPSYACSLGGSTYPQKKKSKQTNKQSRRLTI